MKKTILSLIMLTLLAFGTAASAQITPTISIQGTNATLRWASTPGDVFVVLYRPAFHPEFPWDLLSANVPAGGGVETFFQHVGVVPKEPTGVGGGGGGGGGGGSPPVISMVAIAADDPAINNQKDKPKDKPKEKPGTLPAFPALPDTKAIEKWIKDMLKERERTQQAGGTFQPVMALMTSSISAAQATNVPAGYYVITRVSDDSDGDGLPDWYEAANGLLVLEADATADFDGDGASNLAEYQYGTNPGDPNSKPTVQITFTSPVNTSTYLPAVQITGSLNLNVRTLTFNVTNAAGIQTGLEGFVTQRTVVPGAGYTNSPARTTNSFQCFDVPLTNGVNYVGLHFIGADGLTFNTNVSFTVDFNASPAMPLATVHWPANGTKLGTDTFTLRGWVDNPTASVVARLTIDGEEQEFGGLVERDGTFWVENLPPPASGPMQLIFTDAAGKTSTKVLTYTRAPVTITLSEPAGSSLWDQAVSLSGTVSDPAYRVWVNSESAVVDASGNWTAENVPLNAGGVASFAVRAIPPGGGGGVVPKLPSAGGQGGLYIMPTGNPSSASAVDATFDFNKPPRIVVSSYTMRLQNDDPTPEMGATNRQSLDWTRSGAGYSGNGSTYWQMKYPPYYYPVIQQSNSVTYPFPGTNGLEQVTGYDYYEAPFSYTNVTGAPSIPWELVSIGIRSTNQTLYRKANTYLELETGGKADPDVLEFWEFNTTAQYREPLTYSWYPEAGANVQLFGRSFDTNNLLDMVVRLQNTRADVTPVLLAAGRYPWYQEFSVDVGKVRYAVELAGKVRNGWPRRLSQACELLTGSRPLVLGYDQLSVYAKQDPFANMPEQIIYQLGPAGNTVTNQFLSGTNGIGWIGGRFQPPMDHVGYVNPTVANSVRVTVATSRTNASSRVYPIRTVARAVSAMGFDVPNQGHGAEIGNLIASMGYNDTALVNPLTGSAITNYMPQRLIWYSFSHAITSKIDGFRGIMIMENGVENYYDSTDLPATNYNYALVFINGCMSAWGQETARMQTALNAKVYVGWQDYALAGVAADVAKTFFTRLAAVSSGVPGSVYDARLAVEDEFDNQNIAVGAPVVSSFSINYASGTNMILNLTR